MKLRVGVFLENLSRKLKFRDNLTRMPGILYENLYILMMTYFRILLRMRNDSDKVCTVNQNQNFTFNSFFSENLAVYETMWKKFCGAGEATDDNIIRRIRFACWKNKAKSAHLICNSYHFSTITMVTRNHLNVML
jgi:hypothetical protein